MIIGIILAILLFLFLLYLYLLKPNTKRKSQMKPFEERYIAHRGLFNNKSSAPENTLPAFERAVKAGYGIELDVQLSKDGKLVVLHDPMLSRMCGVDKALADCTYEELQQYKILKSKQSIPLFEDVLKIVDGKVPMIVEIKASGDFLETTRKLDERMRSYSGIYCVESFHPAVVRWYKKNHPEILRGQLSTDYLRDGVEITKFRGFVMANLLTNFLTKPDFIAYNQKFSDQISLRICMKLFDVGRVGWTFRSQEALEEKRSLFDVYIFDRFIPNQNVENKER